MPSSLTLTGIPALTQRLRALETSMIPQLAEAVHQQGLRMLLLSQPEVPVVTGALQRSGGVFPPQITGSHIEVIIGYGGEAAPYAAEVHENPRAGRTGGFSPSGYPYTPGTFATEGHYHFLSEAFEDVAATYIQDMADVVGQILRREVR